MRVLAASVVVAFCAACITKTVYVKEDGTPLDPQPRPAGDQVKRRRQERPASYGPVFVRDRYFLRGPCFWRKDFTHPGWFSSRLEYLDCGPNYAFPQRRPRGIGPFWRRSPR